MLSFRSYQKELGEIALKENSLIVLPTGLGKTYIALYVILKEIEKKHKVLFLAPTKPLAEQHFQSIRKYVKKTALITGSTKKRDRPALIEENSLIIATPQTAVNFDLSLFDFIIFDEAHKASGNYAYVEIAQRSDARTLALTASPGSNKDKILSIMQNLRLSNIEIKNRDDPDIQEYIHPVTIKWVTVDLPKEYKLIQEKIKSFIKEKTKELQSIGVAIKYSENTSQALEIQKKISSKENKNDKDYKALMLISSILKAKHALNLLESQGASSLKEYFYRLQEDKSKSASILRNSKEIREAIYLAEGYSIANIEHPKVKKLVEIIVKELSKDPKQKIIVFNHYRDNVRHLEGLLSNNPLFKIKRFVGQSSKSDKGLSQKKQKEVIEEFKSGSFNVLLATSVAEEGLDIPAVDTIIFFEPVASEIRSIQRKGRTGRFKEGKIYILITKGTSDEKIYWASRKKEESMKKLIKKIKNNSVNKKIDDFIEKKQHKQIKLIDKIEIKKKDDLTIIIDHREKKSGIHKLIKDFKIEFANLDIGDYLIGEECIVERKSADDFINSIIDGRIFMQASKLISYEKSVIIVEGIIDSERINKNAILGCISALALDFRIPVFFVKDRQDFVNLLKIMAKREQNEEEKVVKLRRIKRDLEDSILQQYIVEGLPFIGAKLAKRLLKKYKKVKKIFNADEKSLSKIDGIGKVKAKKIYDIINKEYSD